jgi:uncharacterized protein YjaG (DUF416 family)
MTRKFSSSALKEALGALSMPCQVGFMLLLCERATPPLRKFSVDTGFDISLSLECLDIGWNSLGNLSRDTSYKLLAERVFESAPDTEDFRHELTSAALDATLCIGSLMRFVSDRNLDNVVESAGLMRDTVYLYVGNTEPTILLEENIINHPLMQRELSSQADDLNQLRSLTTDNAEELLSFLKERAKQTPPLLPL